MQVDAQQPTSRVPGLCQSLPPAAAAAVGARLPLLQLLPALLTAEGAGICTTAAAPAILAAATAGAGINTPSAAAMTPDAADGAGDSGWALPDVRRL
jgi:hypothetical protein